MVPELFRALKVVVDELRLTDKEKANGKYLLTGSANILALPKLSDPLVGRMTVLTLYPFCKRSFCISGPVMARKWISFWKSRMDLYSPLK